MGGSLLLPFLLPSAQHLPLPGWLDGPAGQVIENSYRLIRTAAPWFPVGLVLALAGWGRQTKWIALLALLAALAVAPFLSQGGVALELLQALPGVAAGLWAGGKTIQGIPLQSPGSLPVKTMPDNPFATRETESPLHAAGAAHQQSLPKPRSGKAGLRANRPGSSVSSQATATPHAATIIFSRIIALALLAGVAASLPDFPRWGWILGAGYLVYAGLLLKYPRVWLIVIPAALPVLDLAPWTGRFYFDEFDRLLLVTFALYLWQGARPAGVAPARRGKPMLWLLALSVVISGLVGLSPWPGLDLNAYSNYWGTYNSLRLAKGFLWGGVLFWMFRAVSGEASAYTWLARGTAIGVVAVAVSVLWEVGRFTGFDTATDYRVTGTFSSMHTGGGHIEAWLVLALPMLWMVLFAPVGRMEKIGTALVLLLGVGAGVFTVSRGGVIALLAVSAILAAGGMRMRLRGKVPGVSGMLGLTALFIGMLGVLLAGMAGSFFSQRLSQTGTDAGIRMNHWHNTLEMRQQGIATEVFGMGLGSFPRSYLFQNPGPDTGSYLFAAEGTNAFLRLNSGGTLYMAQQVSVMPRQACLLQMDIRSRGEPRRMEASLCEKKLFNSRNCQWLTTDFPADGRWHRRTIQFNSGEVGAGSWWQRRPVQLSLYNPEPATFVEIDNVRLIGPDGTNAIANGDFALGGDYWFFKSGNHLAWHAKNLGVHLLFEQGWLGVLVMAGLVLTAMARLFPPAWGGRPCAQAMLAGVVGILVVGAVDSLVDAPRLTALIVFTLLAGAYCHTPRRSLRD